MQLSNHQSRNTVKDAQPRKIVTWEKRTQVQALESLVMRGEVWVSNARVTSVKNVGYFASSLTTRDGMESLTLTTILAIY